MQHNLSWSELVGFFDSSIRSVFDSALWLLELFVTPFGDFIDRSSGVSSWIADLLDWFLSLFGINFFYVTPLEFMLGSTLPLIIVFTVYRYVKQ